MPNWCNTCIMFQGNKDDIEKFHTQLNEWTSKTFINTDFGETWLGNILYGAHLSYLVDDTNNDGVRCRGWLTEIGELEEGIDDVCTFSIYTETAWVPMSRMFDEVIKKLKYNIKYAYQAEEPGWGLYEIYDPDGLEFFDDETVYVDMFLDVADEKAFQWLSELKDISYMTEFELKEWLNKHHLKDEKELEKIKFNSQYSYVHIYRYEYVSYEDTT